MRFHFHSVPLPLDKKLRFGFGLLFSVLLILSLISYTSISNLVKNSDWVAHTHEVVASVERVFGDCQDMENGVKGYFIMGHDEEFLKIYRDANKVLYADIDRFKRLTADNALQQKRADDLTVLCREKVALCEDIIHSRGGKDYDMILRSRNYTKRLRAVVCEAIAYEGKLLAVRTRVAAEAEFRARIVLSVLIVVDFLLLVAGYTYILDKIC